MSRTRRCDAPPSTATVGAPPAECVCRPMWVSTATIPAADSRAARRVTRWHTSFTVATAFGLSAAPSASCRAAEADSRLGEL